MPASVQRNSLSRMLIRNSYGHIWDYPYTEGPSMYLNPDFISIL